MKDGVYCTIQRELEECRIYVMLDGTENAYTYTVLGYVSKYKRE